MLGLVGVFSVGRRSTERRKSEEVRQSEDDDKTPQSTTLKLSIDMGSTWAHLSSSTEQCKNCTELGDGVGVTVSLMTISCASTFHVLYFLELHLILLECCLLNFRTYIPITFQSHMCNDSSQFSNC